MSLISFINKLSDYPFTYSNNTFVLLKLNTKNLFDILNNITYINIYFAILFVSFSYF